MKGLVLLLLVAGVGFFGYPIMNEDTSSPCDALERAAIRTTIGLGHGQQQAGDLLMGQLVQGFSKGQFAAVAVKNQHPNLPASLACTMLYWKAITDPEAFRQAAAKGRL